MKKKRLLIVFCLVLASVFLFSSMAFGATNIKVYIDEEQLAFDNPPVIQNGATLVPLRAIFQALGAQVNYENTTQTITGEKGSNLISLKINSNIAQKNDEKITLSTAAQLINGSTMVPLRFISESFNCNVTWDKTTQTINITTVEKEITYYPNTKIPMLENIFDDVNYLESENIDGTMAYYYDYDNLPASAYFITEYKNLLIENGFSYFEQTDDVNTTVYMNTQTLDTIGFSTVDDGTDKFFIIITYNDSNS